jgi:hypothetical protein
MYQLTAVEAAAGFAILLFGDWWAAFPVWGLAGITYLLARRVQRKEAGGHS